MLPPSDCLTNVQTHNKTHALQSYNTVTTGERGAGDQNKSYSTTHQCHCAPSTQEHFTKWEA